MYITLKELIEKFNLKLKELERKQRKAKIMKLNENYRNDTGKNA